MYNSDQRPKLVATPTWSPQPAEISNFQSYDSFDGSYQDGSTSWIYHNGYRYRNDANFHYPNNVESNSAQMNVIDQSALFVVSNDAKEEGKKEKRKKLNAESKAREREHIKSIEESHIKNDELVNEIKYKFNLWDGYDPYSRYLLQKLCKDYKSIPKKQRMQKSLNVNLNNAPSRSANTCYCVPHGNFYYHPDLGLHSHVNYSPHQIPQFQHDELQSSQWTSYNEQKVTETSPSSFIKKGKRQYHSLRMELRFSSDSENSTSDEIKDTSDTESESSVDTSEHEATFALFLHLTLEESHNEN
uniref:Uncharacterized protein n=1 Tax=Panagrolaimus davidi TaxID=227884 RepID=A0A914QNB6_9BILA